MTSRCWRWRRLAFALLIGAAISGCVSLERGAVAPETLAIAGYSSFRGYRYSADRPEDAPGLVPDSSGPGQNFTVLALSGGGPDGAYGAGLLAGWSESGHRPSFNVVTGVSTGALIAPYAFLGSSQDAHLRALYTGTHLKTILRQGSALRLLNNPGLYRNRQLKALIDENITDVLITAVATQAAQGRKLLVATANLDAQQLIIWDLSALAMQETAGARVLFRQILLASVSVPLAFDPVEISTGPDPRAVTELHADAGVFTNIHAGAELFPVDDCKAGKRRCALYAIVHHKMIAEPVTVKWNAASVGRRALETLIKANLNTRMATIWQMTKAHGIAFHMTNLDVPFPTASPINFDVSYMRRLYSIGVTRGRETSAWRNDLPSAQ